MLVLTAFSQRDLIEDARDAGVAAYLVKPFRREELLPAIDDVLSTCRQEWAIDEEIDTLAGGRRAGRPRTRSRPAGVVDEAKGMLMDRHGLSEPEAFAFIQRTAMQTGPRMRDVAQRVVDGDLAPVSADAARHRDRGDQRRPVGGPLFLLDGMSLAFRAYFALPPTSPPRPAS